MSVEMPTRTDVVTLGFGGSSAGVSGAAADLCPLLRPFDLGTAPICSPSGPRRAQLYYSL